MAVRVRDCGMEEEKTKVDPARWILKMDPFVWKTIDEIVTGRRALSADAGTQQPRGQIWVPALL